jgi:methyl-accepting chemotaxis protein
VIDNLLHRTIQTVKDNLLHLTNDLHIIYHPLRQIYGEENSYSKQKQKHNQQTVAVVVAMEEMNGATWR